MSAKTAAEPPQQAVVIITGAGAGIGRACALRFARAGCAVLSADLDETSAGDTRDQILQGGGQALALAIDVSDAGSCERMATTALDAWGRIDVLVANAGVQIGGNLLEATENDWETILGVNSKGVALCCRSVLPSMIAQARGSIVINSSINALRGSPGMAIYDMSKAAVLGLARSLAVEYGSRGIRVNAVCPGNTITDFHIKRMAEKGIDVDQIREMSSGYALLGRAAEPGEIANAVYFLASEEASFITGHTLCVDGGFSVTGGA
jgi:meso-butanediol dehydrogenase/(S,S)-butanediol dehydrogenase/diacetyl reductase